MVQEAEHLRVQLMLALAGAVVDGEARHDGIEGAKGRKGPTDVVLDHLNFAERIGAWSADVHSLLSATTRDRDRWPPRQQPISGGWALAEDSYPVGKVKPPRSRTPTKYSSAKVRQV